MGETFPPTAVERHTAFVKKFFSFLPKKESSHFLTTFFFFLWKKKINIILFLFRLVGNLLHHSCCYIPTVHLQPFNFHKPAPARPTGLRIANISPPDKASYTQHQFSLRMPISVKKIKKEKEKKDEAAEVCCTLETDYYHVYRWRLSSRSLNNLLVKSRKKGCTVNTTSLKLRFHFPATKIEHTYTPSHTLFILITFNFIFNLNFKFQNMWLSYFSVLLFPPYLHVCSYFIYKNVIMLFLHFWYIFVRFPFGNMDC